MLFFKFHIDKHGFNGMIAYKTQEVTKMLKLTKLISALSIIFALMFTGCTTTTQQKIKPAGEGNVLSKAKAAGFTIVDFNYVSPKAGVRKLKEVVLIDARPARKYEQATIPGALNLPDTKFAKYYPNLEKLGITKDVEVITFCGGFKCIKSLHDAKMLRDKGFKNIKIYLAGMPDWKKHNTYVEISLAAAYKKLGKAVFVDARPARKFKKETIAGSINIPDTKFMKKENRAKYLRLLPQDKNAEIIVYCGGYHCIKSHNVANILVKDYGYKNVKVMAAGLPGWKKAGYSAKESAAKAGKTASAGTAATGIKLGADEGTVEKEWFKTIIDPASRPKNIIIVDVRTPAEYAEGHVEGAINIPVDLIFASDDSGCTVVPPKIDKLTAKGDVIFMCASGGRAGDMYFELVEECKYPKKDKIHFLDAHVDYSSGKCEIK